MGDARDNGGGIGKAVLTAAGILLAAQYQLTVIAEGRSHCRAGNGGNITCAVGQINVMGRAGSDGRNIGVRAGDVAALCGRGSACLAEGSGIVRRLGTQAVGNRRGRIGVVVGIERHPAACHRAERLRGRLDVISQLDRLCRDIGFIRRIIGIRRHKRCRQIPCQRLPPACIGGHGNTHGIQ